MDPCSADDDRQNYPMYELPVTAYDLLSWAKGNSVSFFSLMQTKWTKLQTWKHP